jgi:phage regulator Rha-like protein
MGNLAILERHELNEDFTITTVEVAEMMGVQHWEVLRKLEGGKDRKGILNILTDNQMVVANYFIEAIRVDGSGKRNKCYDCTKMGCELLANKFTGEKGVMFSAKYVERFNKMESVLRGQLVSNYKLLSTEFSSLSRELNEKINKLEEQAKENHRPSHKTKLDWHNVIKSYSVCKGDEEALKQATLDHFNASKWQDIPYHKQGEVLRYIRETAKQLGMFEQLELREA